MVRVKPEPLLSGLSFANGKAISAPKARLAAKKAIAFRENREAAKWSKIVP